VLGFAKWSLDAGGRADETDARFMASALRLTDPVQSRGASSELDRLLGARLLTGISTGGHVDLGRVPALEEDVA
jgi:hypothetical protein